MSTILIADDEARIRRLVSDFLKRDGHTILEAADGKAALELIENRRPTLDLAILDVMMPGMDGFEVLREIREQENGEKHLPVMLLTARAEDADQVRGLEGGADDYVVKPFSPRELVARVKVVLARTMPKTQEGGESFVFGDLVIDTASHSVKIAGEEAPLTPKEFDLLVFLVSNKGLALSREKILQKVWNYDYYGEDRTVDTHIKMLRGHLGPCRKFIVTVWGIGYKFDPEVLS